MLLASSKRIGTKFTKYCCNKVFVSNFATSVDDSVRKTSDFLTELGYSRTLSKEIISSLLNPTTGVTEHSLYDLVVSLAGAYEIGEDNGLVPLAKSVELEVARKEGKKMVEFFCILSSGKSIRCQGLEGMSLKDIVEYGSDVNCEVLSQYLECACSGIMACSTCHVYVTDKWFEKLNRVCPVTEAELDMIDLAFEPKSTSRLGCQINLDKSFEGFEISFPEGSNNLFDHIPFQD